MIRKSVEAILIVLGWLLVVTLCLPVVLVFSTSADGGITVWNFVGAAYGIGLYITAKKILK